MSLCGMTVFDELKLLFPATDLKTISYAEITKKLKERFDKVESEILLRYKFRCRRQGPSESGENFILAVKLLAEACDFGQFRDTAITDQLVFGIYDKELQRRLLNEDDLVVRTAEKIIKSFDMANVRSQTMNEETGVNSVKHRLGRKPFDDQRDRRRSRSRGRNFFNRDTHSYYSDRERARSGQRQPGRGRYANFICNFCKLKGHIQKHCFRFKQQSQNQNNMVNFVEKEAEPENVHDYFKRLKFDYDSDSDDEEGDYPC